VYKPGADNRVADALSCHGHLDELMAISAPVPSWLDAVKARYLSDVKAQDLLTKLALSDTSETHFTLQQGLLRYKGRLWVGNNLQLQHRILDAFHSFPMGGHSGFPATYQRIKQLFAWIGLKSLVQQFVSACLIC
jgi:hypothetical protein